MNAGVRVDDWRMLTRHAWLGEIGFNSSNDYARSWLLPAPQATCCKLQVLRGAVRSHVSLHYVLL